MPQTGKLMPNLDQNTTKMLNLTVLQRMDPNIEEVLITAAHVTFYEFNIETSQWSRKDVEGSLFVVKRNTQPRFQFIVMNRRSTENLVENLLGDFEYEIQVPYLLYRNSSQEVNGIWFYNSDECKEVANLFNRILNAYSKVPANPKAVPTKSEFEELEAVPNMSIVEGSLETSPTAPTPDAPEDSAFANIFASALNLGNNASNIANLRLHQHLVATVPLSSQTVHVCSSSAPYSDVPSVSLRSPFNQFSWNDSTVSSGNGVNNLLKPSSFLPPTSFSPSLMIPPISSTARAAANNPLNSQRHEGMPLLQSFPPPNPSPLLAPCPTGAERPSVTREKIREALLMLVQDERFIDMFYQTLMKV